MVIKRQSLDSRHDPALHSLPISGYINVSNKKCGIRRGKELDSVINRDNISVVKISFELFLNLLLYI